MFYFYKPKYDALYGPYDSMEEAQNDFDKEGGTAQFYDHKPTEEEMKQEQLDYFKIVS